MTKYWGGIRVVFNSPSVIIQHGRIEWLPGYTVGQFDINTNSHVISRDDCTDFTEKDITNIGLIYNITIMENVYMYRSDNS